MRKLRPFLHLPRLVKHERRGDEHDAKSNRGVSSPVFRVREPPAVRGPHLRRVERSSRRRTRSSHFLTSSESSSSSVCLRMIKVRTHRLRLSSPKTDDWKPDLISRQTFLERRTFRDTDPKKKTSLLRGGKGGNIFAERRTRK